MQKTGNTLRIATRPEENRATAICSMYKKLVKFGYVVLELCNRTDRQTDNRQTHHNTSRPYGSTAHHVYSSAAMERDKHIVCQLYSITAYG